MPDKLHILNGFSTLRLFETSDILGDSCVWNEILSEGPAVYEVATDLFWSVRKAFVTEAFGGHETTYDQLVTDFLMIENFGNYQEVVLWYEYDLFCQINLMALLSWFHQAEARSGVKISLICAGDEPGYDRLVGLGQLPKSYYPTLYEKRVQLSDANLLYADQVWKAYCAEDPNELVFATVPHPVFQYLYQTIPAHLQRFPNSRTGLNEIEWEILQYINSENINSVDDVVRHMLQWQIYYGFGDLQYFHALKKLEAFLSYDQGVDLNDIGKEALSDGISRTLYPSLDLPLGGSSAHQYHWKDGSLIRLKQ